MRKQFGISLALSVASLAAVAGMVTPASASVNDCPDAGVACAYVDINYGGRPIWQESSPGYYSFTGAFRKTSSVINRTSYMIKLVAENPNLSLCIQRGHAVRILPEPFHDKLRSIQIKPPSNSCTETR